METIRCLHCGTWNDADQGPCSECGQPLKQEPDEPTDETSPGSDTEPSGGDPSVDRRDSVPSFGPGIASLLLCFLAMISTCLLLAGLGAFQAYTKGIYLEPESTRAIVVAVATIPALIGLPGVGLGVWGFVQDRRKRMFPILGIAGNLLIAGFIAGLLLAPVNMGLPWQYHMFSPSDDTAIEPETPAAASLPDRSRLLSHLKTAEYDLLERRLTSIQEKYQNTKETDRTVEYAFQVFESADPTLEEKLTEWNQQYPGSYAAPLAKGIYYEHLGWVAHGKQSSSGTGDSRIEHVKKYFKKARENLSTALERNPKLTLVHARRIHMAMIESEDTVPSSRVENGLGVDPSSFLIRQYALQSMEPDRGGSYRAIRRFLKQTEQHLSSRPVLRNLMGYLYFARGNQLRRDDYLKRSLPYFSKSLEFGPFYWYYLHRGKAHRGNRQYQKAVNDFTIALRRWPQSPEILAQRARSHTGTNQTNRALDDYSRALELDPYNSFILTCRASLLESMNNYEEADADYEKALHYRSFDPDLWNTLAELRIFQRKKYVEGRKAIQTAIDLEPGNAEHWYIYSSALFYLKDCEVIQALEKYLERCDCPCSCDEKKKKWARRTLKKFRQKPSCSPGPKDS